MPLEPTFSLTPTSANYYIGAGDRARFYVWGADFYPWTGSRPSLNQQCANDELFFLSSFAADPALDYTLHNNRRQTRHIQLFCDLRDYTPNKELALVFGFDVTTPEARLLVYSSAGQLEDVMLVQGDNQFLMEVESLESAFTLFFIHARRPSYSVGGSWYFQGITGYVI
jgi:hypothetical protein